MYKDFEFTVDSAFVLRCKVSDRTASLKLIFRPLGLVKHQNDKPGFSSRTDNIQGLRVTKGAFNWSEICSKSLRPQIFRTTGMLHLS